eukprot:TRINITY_DN11212_c0_g1_i1.p1 TRINITY_DN11212_c0_g1~~TRINITY_DN11212_c0_g1_i1.p1  ORF type:complete len:2678 (+),score=738.91 TRINITY_DN11212_c0_g1_i1:123-8156(+)
MDRPGHPGPLTRPAPVIDAPLQHRLDEAGLWDGPPLAQQLPGLAEVCEGRSEYFVALANTVVMEVQRLLRYSVIRVGAAARSPEMEKAAQADLNCALRNVLEYFAEYVDDALLDVGELEEGMVSGETHKRGEETEAGVITKKLGQSIAKIESLQNELEAVQKRNSKMRDTVKTMRVSCVRELMNQRERARSILIDHLPHLDTNEMSAALADLGKVAFADPIDLVDDETQTVMKQQKQVMESAFAEERDMLMHQIQVLTEQEQDFRFREKCLQKRLERLAGAGAAVAGEAADPEGQLDAGQQMHADGSSMDTFQAFQGGAGWTRKEQKEEIMQALELKAQVKRAAELHMTLLDGLLQQKSWMENLSGDTINGKVILNVLRSFASSQLEACTHLGNCLDGSVMADLRQDKPDDVRNDPAEALRAATQLKAGSGVLLDAETYKQQLQVERSQNKRRQDDLKASLEEKADETAKLQSSLQHAEGELKSLRGEVQSKQDQIEGLKKVEQKGTQALKNAGTTLKFLKALKWDKQHSSASVDKEEEEEEQPLSPKKIDETISEIVESRALQINNELAVDLQTAQMELDRSQATVKATREEKERLQHELQDLQARDRINSGMDSSSSVGNEDASAAGSPVSPDSPRRLEPPQEEFGSENDQKVTAQPSVFGDRNHVAASVPYTSQHGIGVVDSMVQTTRPPRKHQQVQSVPELQEQGTQASPEPEDDNTLEEDTPQPDIADVEDVPLQGLGDIAVTPPEAPQEDEGSLGEDDPDALIWRSEVKEKPTHIRNIGVQASPEEAPPRSRESFVDEEGLSAAAPCLRCGADMTEEALFCSRCGASRSDDMASDVCGGTTSAMSAQTSAPSAQEESPQYARQQRMSVSGKALHSQINRASILGDASQAAQELEASSTEKRLAASLFDADNLRLQFGLLQEEAAKCVAESAIACERQAVWLKKCKKIIDGKGEKLVLPEVLLDPLPVLLGRPPKSNDGAASGEPSAQKDGESESISSKIMRQEMEISGKRFTEGKLQRRRDRVHGYAVAEVRRMVSSNSTKALELADALYMFHPHTPPQDSDAARQAILDAFDEEEDEDESPEVIEDKQNRIDRVMHKLWVLEDDLQDRYREAFDSSMGDRERVLDDALDQALQACRILQEAPYAKTTAAVEQAKMYCHDVPESSEDEHRQELRKSKSQLRCIALIAGRKHDSMGSGITMQQKEVVDHMIADLAGLENAALAEKMMALDAASRGYLLSSVDAEGKKKIMEAMKDESLQPKLNKAIKKEKKSKLGPAKAAVKVKATRSLLQKGTSKSTSAGNSPRQDSEGAGAAEAQRTPTSAAAQAVVDKPAEDVPSESSDDDVAFDLDSLMTNWVDEAPAEDHGELAAIEMLENGELVLLPDTPAQEALDGPDSLSGDPSRYLSRIFQQCKPMALPEYPALSSEVHHPYFDVGAACFAEAGDAPESEDAEDDAEDVEGEAAASQLDGVTSQAAADSTDKGTLDASQAQSVTVHEDGLLECPHCGGVLRHEQPLLPEARSKSGDKKSRAARSEKTEKTEKFTRKHKAKVKAVGQLAKSGKKKGKVGPAEAAMLNDDDAEHSDASSVGDLMASFEQSYVKDDDLPDENDLTPQGRSAGTAKGKPKTKSKAASGAGDKTPKASTQKQSRSKERKVTKQSKPRTPGSKSPKKKAKKGEESAFFDEPSSQVASADASEDEEADAGEHEEHAEADVERSASRSFSVSFHEAVAPLTDSAYASSREPAASERPESSIAEETAGSSEGESASEDGSMDYDDADSGTEGEPDSEPDKTEVTSDEDRSPQRSTSTRRGFSPLPFQRRSVARQGSWMHQAQNRPQISEWLLKKPRKKCEEAKAHTPEPEKPRVEKTDMVNVETQTQMPLMANMKMVGTQTDVLHVLREEHTRRTIVRGTEANGQKVEDIKDMVRRLTEVVRPNRKTLETFAAAGLLELLGQQEQSTESQEDFARRDTDDPTELEDEGDAARREQSEIFQGNLQGVAEEQPGAGTEQAAGDAEAPVNGEEHEEVQAMLQKTVSSLQEEMAKLNQPQPAGPEIEVVDVAQQGNLVWAELPFQLLDWLKTNLLMRQQADLYCTPWQITPVPEFEEFSRFKREEIILDFEHFISATLCRKHPTKHESRAAVRKLYRIAANSDRSVAHCSDGEELSDSMSPTSPLATSSAPGTAAVADPSWEAEASGKQHTSLAGHGSSQRALTAASATSNAVSNAGSVSRLLLEQLHPTEYPVVVRSLQARRLLRTPDEDLADGSPETITGTPNRRSRSPPGAPASANPTTSRERCLPGTGFPEVCRGRAAVAPMELGVAADSRPPIMEGSLQLQLIRPDEQSKEASHRSVMTVLGTTLPDQCKDSNTDQDLLCLTQAAKLGLEVPPWVAKPKVAQSAPGDSHFISAWLKKAQTALRNSPAPGDLQLIIDSFTQEGRGKQQQHQALLKQQEEAGEGALRQERLQRLLGLLCHGSLRSLGSGFSHLRLAASLVPQAALPPLAVNARLGSALSVPSTAPHSARGQGQPDRRDSLEEEKYVGCVSWTYSGGRGNKQDTDRRVPEETTQAMSSKPSWGPLAREVASAAAGVLGSSSNNAAAAFAPATKTAMSALAKSGAASRPGGPSLGGTFVPSVQAAQDAVQSHLPQLVTPRILATDEGWMKQPARDAPGWRFGGNG